ncbi:NAD(P)/FAD-dependent oxidoreductase [Aneurinibacillus thermoaerophilus]|uniref:Ferredoxin--NADP reductase n=1 Tax=Aneurinibacillus thermoaerophilus TaxID=143495 RepID=A0A1G8BX72_ANETH|nr:MULTISPECIES: NAD(P)/FAD-dependent oxidoreductase [Aneurinibacillus]AMA71996.1 ferredoxin--NADP(+) reductase [Aneurinibacillus sp. XH2]MED0675125.1 NAD(P)/FAD-dependent oxidoreductase [Aneurinibacillus thermoaerophilus]MED0757206.1 NAD(P)/FAD-dependent oxidoreductase [Aneurinibacillus thermoaerophilus]MED0762470.1 NAD(P)/FAD-dependent oxidoreductase [Aneurinibacillus thermoaerophilus]QYY42236.1 NAD(P)/FAD-dependent oxidoreductase [Aneurinibacillus thermoaerophilus]
MGLTRDEKVYDITVVGGGPAGLFTAFYAGMRQCSCKIIESMPQLGGQLSALYPEKFIYDVAGFPKIRAQELIDRLKEQVAHFETEVCLEEKVINVEKKENIFEITTEKGLHYSRTVIITAGVGAFEPRKLELPNADKFEKANLHYFVDDLNKFAGQNVIVFGGGDSAVDWALMLEPIAKKVTIVHRRDKFRAHEHSVENLMKSKVNVMTPYEPYALEGEDKIEKVVLRNNQTEELITEEVDAVIVNFGFISSLGPIKNWGLELDRGSIVVNSKMETNIPGIYAAGDVTTYPGKIKLIAVGFGEAPTAVNNAKSYMDPDAKVQPMHSSSMKM